MSNLATLEKSLHQQIEAQKPALETLEPRLKTVRRDAMRQFQKNGLPSRKDEAWRWTDLSALQNTQALQPVPATVNIKELPIPFTALDACRLVFVNGLFREDLSDAANLPVGVSAGALSTALQRDPDLVKALGNNQDAPFLNLNTALLKDGAFIRVADSAQVSRPMHVIYFNDAGAQVRNLILLGANAALTLLESHYGPADANYFVNQASDIVLGAGAALSHVRDQAESLQASHFHYLNAQLDAGARYNGFTLTRGAHLSRNESCIQITDRHAQCSLNGAYLLNEKQTADTTSIMDHQAPDCQSRQLFRGVLDGQSRGIFQGLVRVRKAAQRTDAQQQIKALLLSPGAVQNSKPELEILADDVKCAHGATVGQIDEGALFYLRARGIPLAQARAMLIGAFLEDAVTQIEGVASLDGGKIHNIISAVIDNWLAQQMAVAHV